MCGPCTEGKKPECRSQNTTRPTTACQACSVAKKTCNPPAQWALPVIDAITERSTYFRSFLIIGHSARVHTHIFTPHTDSGRNNNEDTRQDLYELRLMVGALCRLQGINPADIPGFGLHAPRRSISPSVLSTTSAASGTSGASGASGASGSSIGLPMSSLTVSDVPTRSSARSESPTSARASRRGTGSGRSSGSSRKSSAGWS